MFLRSLRLYVTIVLAVATITFICLFRILPLWNIQQIKILSIKNLISNQSGGPSKHGILSVQNALHENISKYEDSGRPNILPQDSSNGIAKPNRQSDVKWSDPWKKLKECPCDFDQWESAHSVTKEIETNEEVLIPYFQSQGFLAQYGVGKRREVLDPEFEVPLFRYPPLYDSRCLPDTEKSNVYLLNPRGRYTVGDDVQFRVDVVTACGNPRKLGGDVVRMWLKSPDGKLSTAARVSDLGNGSYIGSSVLTWAGDVTVRASLTYPREFLRGVLEVHHSLHSTRWITNVFDNGLGVSEPAPCLPSSPIPGYSRLCDFTVANGGRPWFCGHPSKEGLNCSHWSTVSTLMFLAPVFFSKPLRDYVHSLDKCCESSKSPDLRLVHNDIRIKVEAGGEKSPRQEQCSSRPLQESWDSPSPRGWLDKGSWRSLTCHLPDLTKERLQRCLRNTTLLLFGDSNQRLLWLRTTRRLQCDPQDPALWHAPRLCRDPGVNAAVLYMSHAQPFSVGHRDGLQPVPLSQALQTLALQHGLLDHGHRVVVVLHYYMHFSTFPIQVFKDAVRYARRQVEGFLRLVPHAKVFIRGPHVLYRGNNHHLHAGDNFGPSYTRIWRQEFSPLVDRVAYLDFWDLTLAAENVDSHPEPVLADEMVKTLFGYMSSPGNVQGMESSNGRLTRWVMQLQPYVYTVNARPGKDNVGADFLKPKYKT